MPAASPTRIRLDEAITQVVDHMAGVCRAAIEPGGRLEGITRVVTGGRGRSRPDPPYLWVTLGAATAEHARSLHERWTAAVLLSVFVRSEEPEDAWLDAIVWASRARSEVLRDRTLGDELGFVEDTQSAEVGPLGQFRAGRKFGGYARLNVRLAIVEPKE